MRLNIDWLVKIPIAHRGLHTNNSIIPENSLLAFQAAVDKNYPIELDVRLLADGNIVVFHDENLDRMTGIDKRIESCSEEDVGKLRLLGSDQRIPLLDEVLSLVDGQVPILIEIKNTGYVGKLEQALYKLLSTYSGDYAIQSFNPFSLKWFRKNAPHICRGQLAGGFKNEKDLEFYKRFILKNMYLNFQSRPHFIAYEWSCLNNFAIRRVRNKGLYVLAWTITSQEQYALARAFCDNVIFEGDIGFN